MKDWNMFGTLAADAGTEFSGVAFGENASNLVATGRDGVVRVYGNQ